MSYRYEEEHGMTSPSSTEGQHQPGGCHVDEPIWKRYLRLFKVLPASCDEEESNDERILRISLWCIFLLNFVVAIAFLAIQPSIPTCCGKSIFSTMLFDMDWNLLSRILPWIFLILVLLEGLTCSVVFLQPVYAMFIPMVGFFLLYLIFLDIGPSMTLFLFSIMTISLFMRYISYRLQNNRIRKTTKKRTQDDKQERRGPPTATRPSCLLVWALNINTLVELLILVIIIMTLVAGGFCFFTTDGGDNRPTFFAASTDALSECPDCSVADDVDSVCQICNVDTEHQCYFPFAWR